jgi:hypothetical protein
MGYGRSLPFDGDWHVLYCVWPVKMIGARCLAGREAGLILPMFGAIQKKIAVWYSGFGGSRAQTDGATIRCLW